MNLPRSEKSKKSKTSISELEAKKLIRDLELKVTPQRMLILKLIHSGRRHFTTQEIYELISQQDPNVGFATVYRFLRHLSEKKYVTELNVGGSTRYEMTPHRHHDHISCTSCGAIFEFENYQIELLQEEVAKKLGFELTGHVLELYGICPTCQKKEV